MIYLDSSALVKLAVREPESAALLRFLESWPERVASALARVEVLRAVRRTARSTANVRRAEQVLERVALVPVDDAVLAEASRLEPMSLRSLDAIHLATALSLRPLEAFVGYDDRLLEGARRLGCRPFSPR